MYIFAINTNNINMKKLIIIAFIIILLCTYGFTKTKNETKNFIQENNLMIADFIPYISYENFDPLLYLEYEKVRNDTEDYLFAINTVTHKNFYLPFENKEKALFIDTTKVLVNKHYYLSSSYVPSDLIKISALNCDYIERDDEMLISAMMKDDLQKMISDSKLENLNLTIFSCYRSYQTQEELFYIINNQNDAVSARPGHSEHQTGLAVDISTRDSGLTSFFESTIEYAWLSTNCYKYGFIERYKNSFKDKTLYEKESWHYRYVGKEISEIIYKENISYEEYVLKYLEF